MGHPLLQHHRFSLLPALIITVVAFSIAPAAHAKDMTPASRHIKFSPAKSKDNGLPNIISGKSGDESSVPIPEQKPGIAKKETQQETITDTDSVIKTIKFGAMKTKKVKTTKETISPAVVAPEPVEKLSQPRPQPPAPKQKPQRVVMPAPKLDYCDQAQQSDMAKAATSGQPFSNTEKDNGLAASLRVYMKTKSRDPALIDALYEAAQETGVSFELMTIKAMVESDLGSHTIAANSSARGIFQYIDSTWLSLIKRHGENIGYVAYANALIYDSAAQHYKANESSGITLEEILNLRNDARATSFIKAYQIIDEQEILKGFREGKAPNITDHYIMHMLGIPLARTFYSLKNSNSSIIPAYLKNGLFNEAIALNPSFFYDENKNGLNAAGIYERFARTTSKKIDELRAIDRRYGTGTNVLAHGCTPAPIMPRIHKPSSQVSLQSTRASAIEPAAGEKKSEKRETRRSRQISSVDLLRFEPTPVSTND